ncbi:2-C-methyl-D-erythritol 2,4-cyclodiphosphate synthase [Chloroflexota bacterium]
MRVGIGYDVHPLVEGRRLVLGGVEIPFDKGLDGHSDADVLVHSIIDALLGAAGLKDIGAYFPSDDPQYKNISSLILLRRVAGMITEKGWSVGNIDAAVIAEKPSLLKYIPEMKRRIAETLGIGIEQVGVKSTTAKGLGFLGREEGIAVHAVVLIEGI